MTNHAAHCRQPEFDWQQQIWPGLAARGRRTNCGAVTFGRSGQTVNTPGDAELRRRRNRKGMQ